MLNKLKGYLKGYKRIIALVIYVINGTLLYTGMIDKTTSELIFTLATGLGFYGTWDAMKK